MKKYKLTSTLKSSNPKGVVQIRIGEKDSYWCACPCRKRSFNLLDHTVNFDEEKVMTVKESIASHENRKKCPDDYCHLYIKDGLVEYCEDATCEGARNEIKG